MNALLGSAMILPMFINKHELKLYPTGMLVQSIFNHAYIHMYVYRWIFNFLEILIRYVDFEVDTNQLIMKITLIPNDQ